MIEPKPELRVPMQELQQHPWLTSNGKTPFATYLPPPKDKLMRHQVSNVTFMCILSVS